ncbi:MAG: substrate-binding domain-containing protein [Abitibacteriaceae bacterium]|nr:substrate-binding domain-containing protein [Abditibacteriaceae bacterium]
MPRAIMPSTTKPALGKRSKNSDIKQVAQDLDRFCATLHPGDRLPTHTELMHQFRASERTMLRALDELQRAGKIVRRNGVGTFISDWQDNSLTGAPLLADNRTIIALTKPDHSFFDRCMDLLFRHVETADLALLCRLINPDNTPSLALPPSIQQPLGFILFRYDLAPLARQLQDAGCRVVMVGAPPVDVTPEVPCIYSDHERGGYLATRHLLTLGHQRIAFLGFANVQQTLRWRGHQKAIKEAQRQTPNIETTILPQEKMSSWAKSPERAAAYFSKPGAPTGVVAWNDHEAATLLSVLVRAGVKVPEAISLVGYDALPEGTLVYPTLTTVDHAIDEQLQAALSLLTRPTPPPASHTVVVVPSLVSRESCGPPKQ